MVGVCRPACHEPSLYVLSWFSHCVFSVTDCIPTFFYQIIVHVDWVCDVPFHTYLTIFIGYFV